MLKHIVLFKLADEAEGNTKIENALIIKQRLEALSEVIPEIVDIKVRINADNMPEDNYDIMLDCEFENVCDLQIYATHPAHLQVVEFIGKVRTARAAIDLDF